MPKIIYPTQHGRIAVGDKIFWICVTCRCKVCRGGDNPCWRDLWTVPTAQLQKVQRANIQNMSGADADAFLREVDGAHPAHVDGWPYWTSSKAALVAGLAEKDEKFLLLIALQS